MSRPEPSVPKTWAALGGLRRWPMFERFAESGTATRPATAATTTSAISTSPSSAPFWRLSEPNVSRQKVLGARGARPDARIGEAGASTSAVAAVSGLVGPDVSVIAHSRVHEAVQDVGEQVDHDDPGQQDRDQRLRERIVAREDRVDQEPSEAGPPEHEFDDAGPAE